MLSCDRPHRSKRGQCEEEIKNAMAVDENWLDICSIEQLSQVSLCRVKVAIWNLPFLSRMQKSGWFQTPATTSADRLAKGDWTASTSSVRGITGNSIVARALVSPASNEIAYLPTQSK